MQNAAYLYTLDIWPIGLALLACGIIKMFLHRIPFLDFILRCILRNDDRYYENVYDRVFGAFM